VVRGARGVLSFFADILLSHQLTTGLSSEYSRAPESSAAPASRRVDADKSLFAK
jgi:hypothetical protein